MKWKENLKNALGGAEEFEDESYKLILDYRRHLQSEELTKRQLNRNLAKACTYGKYEWAVACLSLGADANYQEMGFLNPLCSAIDNHLYDLAILLLYSGADVQTKNGLAFRSACYSGHLPLVRSFLSYGLEIDEVEITDRLRDAVSNNSKLKELFIDYGIQLKKLET